MKRLLAALLTFSMIVSIVPFSAFADSPDTVVSPNVSATAQNTSTPTLDADTIQAINSDPLLQGQYLSETSQPTVDTSDVTMEATDGFGKLLVNSINEQNDTSSNRIIGVSVSGNTATVKYVSTTDADIVVSIYTDDSAEEMVASGTAYAPAMVENTGSSTATVAISGTIPEYYTVKCYLLDTAEHAPLCKEYTDDSNTEDIVDLETATIDSFPQDRVINLDDQSVTNFAVVKKGILLINDDSSDAHANSLSENHTVISENGNGSYTIHTSDSRIKSLVPGKILTYQSGDEILIIRVETISVSDDSITITGDDSLDLIDVFDIVKLESSNDDGQLEYDGSGVDKDVHYNGATKDDDELEQTNAFSDDVNFTFTHKFVIGTDTFYDGKKEDDDGAHAVSKFGINAVLNLKLSNQFKYYISATKQTLDYSLTSEASGGVEVAYTGSIKIDLGYFKKKLPGIYINYTPQLVMQTDVKGQFLYTVTSKQGFHCDGFSITDTSQKPVVDFSIKVSGTIYIGVEFAPSVKAGVYKISKPRTDENFLTLMELKLTFSIGAEGSLTPNVPVEPVAVNQISHKFSGNSIHECNACLAGDVYSKVVFSVTVNVIKIFDQTATLLDYRQHILTLYYSINYNDLGFGTCPHNLYLVDITVDAVIPPSGSEVIDGEGQSIGTLSASDKNYCYMRPGTYTLETTIDGNRYSHTFTVGSSNIDVKLTLNGGSSGGGSSGGGSSDPSLWALDENGKLTINNEKVMTDYSDAASTPWYNFRDEITYILTQYMVKKISRYAFADCNKVTTVQIGDDITEIGDYAFSGCTSLEKVVFAGTMAKWKEVQIGIGNEALGYVNIVCSDGTITGHFPELSDSDYVLNDGVLTIYTQNAVNDYVSANQTPWYNLRSSITKIIVKDRVHKIGSYSFWGFSSVKEIVFEGVPSSLADSAFENCFNLQSISYNGTINNWKKIDIQNDSDSPYTSQIFVATIYCTDDTILSQGYCGFEENNLRWILTESKKLIIWGSGKMAEYQTNYSPWWSKNYKTVTIDEGVTSIGRNAFYDTEIESITLPNSIESIEREAFSYAKNLSQLNFSTNLKKIDDYAFSHCDSLKEVNIPDGTVEIGAAFISCSSLERIHFPDSITKLGSMYGCTSLNELHLPCNVTYICNSAFSGCTNLRNITLPANLKEIGEYAFGGCTMLDNVTIPDSVETIYRGAFSNCKNLKTIHLPSSLKNISEYLFSSCSSLQKIILPKNINAINSYAFKECILLEEITIPTKCQNIGIQAFSGCKGLKTIKIPGSVTGIGINAFENCSGLIRIDFDQGLWSIGNHVFSGCNQLSKVSIPDSVKSIGADIFADCDLLSNLTYHGTTTQWNKIKIDANNLKLSQVTIHCTDGDILPISTVSSDENSIFPSTATGDDHSFAASFSDLTPGVSYAVIVSRSESDPLAPENLIYINQFRASSSGYQQSFQTPRSSTVTENDMFYVVAAGSRVFEDTSVNPNPGGSPSGGDTGSDGSSGGSGDGDGSGTGALLLVGAGAAAAAITAGVVLSMPVEVQGKAELADHTALPGAKISLLQDGKVVAQTTADENGSFSLKAKRGSYQLTAAYTDANGQIIHQTIDIKAPAKDLVVTF